MCYEIIEKIAKLPFSDQARLAKKVIRNRGLLSAGVTGLGLIGAGTNLYRYLKNRSKIKAYEDKLSKEKDYSKGRHLENKIKQYKQRKGGAARRGILSAILAGVAGSTLIPHVKDYRNEDRMQKFYEGLVGLQRKAKSDFLSISDNTRDRNEKDIRDFVAKHEKKGSHLFKLKQIS